MQEGLESRPSTNRADSLPWTTGPCTYGIPYVHIKTIVARGKTGRKSRGAAGRWQNQQRLSLPGGPLSAASAWA